VYLEFVLVGRVLQKDAVFGKNCPAIVGHSRAQDAAMVDPAFVQRAFDFQKGPPTVFGR